MFDTNLFAPLAVLRAALPSLRKNRGRVLQLSSMLGEVAWLGSGVYSASKAAIELAMEGLALELAPLGVKVTIVVPGSVPRISRRPPVVCRPMRPKRQRLGRSSEISRPNREKLSENHPAS